MGTEWSLGWTEVRDRVLCTKKIEGSFNTMAPRYHFKVFWFSAPIPMLLCLQHDHAHNFNLHHWKKHVRVVHYILCAQKSDSKLTVE